MKNSAKALFLALLSILTFFGCTSLPDPRDETSSLVIGQIILFSSSFEIINTVNINGEYRSGIEIQIENAATGALTNLRTGSYGNYLSTSLPTGKYKFKKISIKIMNGSYGVTLWADNSSTLVFEVSPGKVNNLGILTWIADKKDGTSFTFNKDFATVQERFEKTYPKSLWIQKEWEEIMIKREK